MSNSTERKNRLWSLRKRLTVRDAQQAASSATSTFEVKSLSARKSHSKRTQSRRSRLPAALPRILKLSRLPMSVTSFRVISRSTQLRPDNLLNIPLAETVATAMETVALAGAMVETIVAQT